MMDSLKKINAPSQNLVFATADGDIGYFALGIFEGLINLGRLPYRKNFNTGIYMLFLKFNF